MSRFSNQTSRSKVTSHHHTTTFGPKVGFTDTSNSYTVGIPKGHSHSTNHWAKGGGVLTFSKQQQQGHHASYSNHLFTPLQDKTTVIPAKHHVEARLFGCGVTPTGPGNIAQARLEQIGRLDAIVRQVEVVVNRFARDVREAEDKKMVGKLRPKLLRSASATEKKIKQAQQYIGQELEKYNLGQGQELDPKSGYTETEIVGLFMVRLGTAARKIYTLGYETPGTELERQDQLNEARKNTTTYAHAPNRNRINLSASSTDPTVVGTYGKYKPPNNYRASGAFFKLDRGQLE